MSRHAWSLWVCLGLGCAHVETEQDLVVPEAPEPPRMQPGIPDEPAPTKAPASASGPACTWPLVEPHRLPAIEPPPETIECRPAPGRKRKAELARAAREAWMWKWPEHEQLDVTHGCDRLGAELSTVIFDSSSGHGGSLELVRLDHRDDGDWDVTWIDYNDRLGRPAPVEGDPWAAEAPGGVTLRRGTLPAARVDPMLRRAREALALGLVEEEPPPRPGFLSGGSFSSNNFHAGMRLVDTAGHGIERWFGGYRSSSDDQDQRVALELAAAEVWTVLGDDAIVAGLAEVGPEDPAIRELLAGAFWAAQARNAEYGAWWVRERLFALVPALGEPELVPALLDAVRTRAGESASGERTRASAINAIAALVGFDARYDAQGKPRPVEVVATEVLAACAR